MSSFAQEDFSLEDDTNDSIPKPKHPSKEAMLYSAIIPGGGQVFNHIHLPRTSRRKWNVYWKVPLIYGAIGGSAYMLFSKQREIGNLKSEYRFRMGQPGGATFEQYQNFDNQAILQLHNSAQTQRDLFILTTVLAYAINILDAAVEAHFINFDVSDDLSLRIQPAATPNFGLGLSFALRFK
jgi:hypothetical protein